MAIQAFTSGQTLTAQQMSDLQKNDYNQTVSAKTTSYTLVAGDVGTHVQMTAATATTISVPAATFAAGDSLFISSQGTGTCTIQAASTAITVTTSSSLALAQYGGGTLRFQSASAATFFNAVGATYGVATGGTSSSITVSSQAYTLLSFATDGNLVVSRDGLFDVVLIGGGGSGGGSPEAGVLGGGGGAGGTIGIGTTQTVYLAAGTYAVTIGAGAARTGQSYTTTVLNGGQTKIGTVLYVAGGGSGGSGDNPSGGVPGGSGGGRCRNNAGGATNGGLGFAGASADGGGGGGTGGAPSGSTGGVGLSLSTFTGGTISTVVAPGGNGNSGAAQPTIIGAGGHGATANTDNARAGVAGAAYVRFKV